MSDNPGKRFLARLAGTGLQSLCEGSYWSSTGKEQEQESGDCWRTPCCAGWREAEPTIEVAPRDLEQVLGDISLLETKSRQG